MAFGVTIPFFTLEVPLRILTLLAVGMFVVGLIACVLMDRPGPTLLEVAGAGKWIAIAVFVTMVILAIVKGISGGDFFIEASSSSSFPNQPDPYYVFDAVVGNVCSPDSEELRHETTTFEVSYQCWSVKYMNPKGAGEMIWGTRYIQGEVCIDLWFPFQYGPFLLNDEPGVLVECEYAIPNDHPSEFRAKSRYGTQVFSVYHDE